MSVQKINFVDYDTSYRDICLQLFDENCPDFFAANERQDYIRFLDRGPSSYIIVQSYKISVAAFGLNVYQGSEPKNARLQWILVSAKSKGLGLGARMMNKALLLAKEQGVETISIAASHLSADFFEKFGAVKLAETEDGWGKGMHRLDMVLKT